MVSVKKYFNTINTKFITLLILKYDNSIFILLCVKKNFINTIKTKPECEEVRDECEEILLTLKKLNYKHY